MEMIRGRSWVVVIAAVVLAGCYGAYQVAPDVAPAAGALKAEQEDKDVGRVGVAPGFDVKGYRVVTVDKFPVSDPAIKDEGDRRLADSMSVFLQSELVRRLRESGLFDRVINLSETEYRPGADRTLKLEGTISRLGEGSQAMRAMFGLYGAGAAKAQAEMRLLDTQTGKAVVVTSDRRQATMGFFGGGSKDHLREAFDDMARDLAKFLVRLSKGEAPRP